MKTLYIMRHGKAENGDNKTDFERKLISKGIKRNLKIALKLKDKKGKFDAILCSKAERTIETAEIMAEQFDFPLANIENHKAFYLAPASIMLEYLYALDNALSNVLLVGHNPGVSELATNLSNQFIDWLPTSALIAIKFDTEKWEEIGSCEAKIVFSLFPKS
jgi:phosphohistidine phosphatase